MPDEIKEKEQAPQVLTESENKGRENRRIKRIRQRASSSQTEDELPNEEHVQGVQSSCTICNNTLDLIQEKLDKVLSFIPEIENLRSRIAGPNSWTAHGSTLLLIALSLLLKQNYVDSFLRVLRNPAVSIQFLPAY